LRTIERIARPPLTLVDVLRFVVCGFLVQIPLATA